MSGSAVTWGELHIPKVSFGTRLGDIGANHRALDSDVTRVGGVYLQHTHGHSLGPCWDAGTVKGVILSDFLDINKPSRS